MSAEERLADSASHDLELYPGFPDFPFVCFYFAGKDSTKRGCLLDLVVEWWPLLLLLGIFWLKILIIMCLFAFHVAFLFGIHMLGAFGTSFFCPCFWLSVAMRPYPGDARYQTKGTSLFAGDPSWKQRTWEFKLAAKEICWSFLSEVLRFSCFAFPPKIRVERKIFDGLAYPFWCLTYVDMFSHWLLAERVSLVRNG